jgi:hypothetical protein
MRDHILTTGFAVVAFSVFVQGLTMTPLLRRVGEIPQFRGCDVERASGPHCRLESLLHALPHGWYEAGQISLAQPSVEPTNR